MKSESPSGRPATEIWGVPGTQVIQVTARQLKHCDACSGFLPSSENIQPEECVCALNICVCMFVCTTVDSCMPWPICGGQSKSTSLGIGPTLFEIVSLLSTTADSRLPGFPWNFWGFSSHSEHLDYRWKLPCWVYMGFELRYTCWYSKQALIH